MTRVSLILSPFIDKGNFMESANQQSTQMQTATQNVAAACATGALSGLLISPAAPIAGCVTAAVVQTAIEVLRPSTAK